MWQDLRWDAEFFRDMPRSLNQVMHGFHYLRPDLHSGCDSLHPCQQCGRARRPSMPPFVVLQKQKTTNGGIGGQRMFLWWLRMPHTLNIICVSSFQNSIWLLSLFLLFIFFNAMLVPLPFSFLLSGYYLPARCLAGKSSPILRGPLHLLSRFLAL